ncbi:MAG TPA: class I SAM-dependent methyltransferase, partial [Gammaproteobacteria bacterium]|nr:class I SAM-dependent methyltransferase [Gammaproteobacteria bacterium]
NVIIKNYLILELSADLRARQQEKILDLCPNFAHKVKWLDHLPQTPINGVIFANEVMDAMPVARFQYANDCLQEYYVAIKNDAFCEIVAAPTTALADAFAANRIADYISQPYTSEINLCLPAWVNSLNACLSTGAILLCDYGFARAEYYHPQRDQGTFMCHYQHTCHDNAFINIGLQDLTAHVDFTTVAEAASACGLTIGGYTNMASFLLNCGVTKFVTQPTVQQAQEVNTLTSPAEMGELFKCIMLTRDVDLPLLGFARYDKSSRL